MVVETAPLAAIVPPAVAGRSDELVRTEFVQHMTAADAPVGVFERAEYGTNHIAFCIVIVFSSHLVVKSLVQVGAA